MNKIAIMQPYFFPYIGYFQLINAVDKFIVYDNIQYTKKGWINRNRILVNGKDEYISAPLKKDSDYLNINERNLADAFKDERQKMLRKLTEAYRKAPYLDSAFPVITNVINNSDENLFTFIYYSVKAICEYLEIKTECIISSAINIDHNLKAADKVKAICKKMEAEVYINPIGGIDMYNKEDFLKEGIALQFLKTDEIVYPQFKNEFVPFLSIVDLMMFNSKEQIVKMLDLYKII